MLTYLLTHLPTYLLSCFTLLTGWSKGTITEANGLKCVISYDDDETSEKVELPDDTIRIVSYPDSQAEPGSSAHSTCSGAPHANGV